MPIGPEEIACLASAKVPDGTNAECEALARDLWEYGTNHPVPAIFVNKSTAAEYLKSLEGRAGVISLHLESATISYGQKSVLWKRVDPRVSKEKLEVKFYMNCRSEKMSIQHSTTDSPFKYRIEISFNKFMGIKLFSGILTADVFGSVIVESKTQQARTWNEEQTTMKSTSTRLVITIHHQSDPTGLQTKLEQIPSLRSAFCIGLCNDYPSFDPTNGDKPYDRLPLVRDPTLVRAAQLAILRLRNVEKENASVDDHSTESNYLQRIVEMFGGIESRFRDRLKYRLLESCQKTSQNQHEE